MAKYGKNNYFDGVVLPEPKEEALRRMAKGVKLGYGEKKVYSPSFNGTILTSSPIQIGTSDFSIEYYGNAYGSGSGSAPLLFNKANLGSSNAPTYFQVYGLNLGRNALNWVTFSVPDGGNIGTDSLNFTYSAPDLSTKFHLVITRQGRMINVYIDNTLVASKEQTEIKDLGAFVLGILNSSDVSFVRVWSYALSAADVSALYNNGDPAGYILPQNLKNIKDMAFTSKTFEFDMDSPYYQRVLESGELESGRKYRVDYVVEEWDIAPAVIGTCGISCGVLSTVGTQYWPNISAAKLGENQYVVVDTKETGTPYMYVYASNPSDTYTSRRLKVTVHSVKMLGCIAEYLPQNLIPTAEGSVVKWLDSAPQLPEANGILPPLDASVGGYDLAAIGNPKIII